jgi:hypothetical protein
MGTDSRRGSYARPVASLVVLADEDPGWQPHGFRTRLAKAIDEQMATWSDALLAAQSLKQVFG